MYSTIQDVRQMLKDEMINEVIGNEFIEDVQEREAKLIPIMEQAVADADAEIDGYLNKRYRLPFVQPPTILNKFSKDIAVYNLVSRMGIDLNERESNYLTRYKAAIAFLTKVATGSIEIGVNDVKANATTGFQMKSSKRLFSRNTLRGM